MREATATVQMNEATTRHPKGKTLQILLSRKEKPESVKRPKGLLTI